MVEEHVIKRLAFIKYLYSIGVEQSKREIPLSSASILTFHDSVELFLYLSREFLEIKKAEHGFLKYWDILSSKVDITQKAGMERLNKTRVNLKHYGTLVSPLDVESFRAITTSFFEENTKTVFGIDFSEISLIDLIHNKNVKEDLITSQKYFIKGENNKALDLMTVAFAKLIDEYEEKTMPLLGRYHPFFGNNIPSAALGDVEEQMGEAIADEFDQLFSSYEDSLITLQEAVKLISFGINYHDFIKFSLVTPTVNRVNVKGSTKYDVFHPLKGQKNLLGETISTPELSEDEFNFCMEFVINTALTLQKLDFDINQDRIKLRMF